MRLTLAGVPIRVDIRLAEGLWAAQVDADQIGQVFHNILLNATQAMPDGGSVEVRAENVGAGADGIPHAESVVRVSIRDTGCGIPADVLPRIFDPYFTTKESGSGLGLATAYAIVSKHGGRLSVESRNGAGTVFVIDLPASAEAAQEEPAREIPIGAPPGRGRLLVMDDEENIRRLLSQVLTRLGYAVTTAQDGEEAIGLYEAAASGGARFDAVLLDLTVAGGLGGVETARRLKAIDSSARLIASSGYSDAPVLSEFREYGFSDALSKPWNIAQLSDVFRRVLEGEET